MFKEQFEEKLSPSQEKIQDAVLRMMADYPNKIPKFEIMARLIIDGSKFEEIEFTLGKMAQSRKIEDDGDFLRLLEQDSPADRRVA